MYLCTERVYNLQIDNCFTSINQLDGKYSIKQLGGK